MDSALARARSGGGPTLVELHTYRLDAHTNADDATRYRASDEVEGWLAKDPIVRLEQYLLATGALDEARIAATRFHDSGRAAIAQDGVGGLRDGFEYARTGNPTRRVLEANIAAIEGGTYGRGFSAGMAATDALLRASLRPGDHLAVVDEPAVGIVGKHMNDWIDNVNRR